jgi:hypothetical protein
MTPPPGYVWDGQRWVPAPGLPFANGLSPRSWEILDKRIKFGWTAAKVMIVILIAVCAFATLMAVGLIAWVFTLI